jgi:hypothetical protein
MHKKFSILVFAAFILAACAGPNGESRVANDGRVPSNPNCLGNLDSDGQPNGPLLAECL